MKALRSLLIDKSVSGHLRVKYHDCTREIQLFTDTDSTIKCLNCNNVLYSAVVADCNEIRNLKKLKRSTKVHELNFNRKYGLIYTNLLVLGSSIKLTDSRIRDLIAKATNDTAIPYENGLAILPFLKLPFFIIMKRYTTNEIISEEE